MKRFKCFWKDDNGSALVSVMAVAIFLSIIATTIIYISGKNYQIKANDYQNKDTFYKAEMALDEFKGALVSDVSDAFVFAYGSVMSDFAGHSGDDRNETYRNQFFDYLYYKWTGDRNNIPNGTDIPGSVEPHAPGGSIYDAAEAFADEAHLTYFNDYFITEGIEPGSEMRVAYDKEKPWRFVLKNICVSYTEKGYSSYICTDIVSDPPPYYMGGAAPEETGPAEGDAGEPAESAEPDTSSDEPVKRLYMGDYIAYINWHKY